MAHGRGDGTGRYTASDVGPMSSPTDETIYSVFAIIVGAILLLALWAGGAP